MRQFILKVIHIVCWSTLSLGINASVDRPPISENETTLRVHLAALLAKPVEGFDSHGQPLVMTLLNIAAIYGIPMGIERVDEDSLHRPLSIHLAHGTVSELLDLCVAQIPGYSWTTQEGTVDVYGLTEWKEKSNLLNLSVQRFAIKDGTLNDANARLREIVFMASSALREKVHAGGAIGFGGDSPGIGNLDARRFDIEMGNPTVRDVLNRLVALSADAGQRIAWIATVPPNQLSGAPQSGLWRLVPLAPSLSDGP